jgi:hypothetical protein
VVGGFSFLAKPSFDFSVGLPLRVAPGLARYGSSHPPELSTGGRSYVLNVLYVLMFPARKRLFIFKNQIVTKNKGEKFRTKGEKFRTKGEKFRTKGEKFRTAKKLSTGQK